MKSAITSKELENLPITVDWYISSITAKTTPRKRHNKPGKFVLPIKLLNNKKPKRKYSIMCNNLSLLKIYKLGMLLPGIDDPKIIVKKNKMTR